MKTPRLEGRDIREKLDDLSNPKKETSFPYQLITGWSFPRDVYSGVI
jgi:hypothetical protein